LPSAGLKKTNTTAVMAKPISFVPDVLVEMLFFTITCALSES
jgi:hypothetical protein